MTDPKKEAHVCKLTPEEMWEKEEQWRLDELIAQDADRGEDDEG